MAIETLEATLNESNIADTLDEDTLRKIGREVKEGYERDMDSRSEWSERMEDALKLASQVVETKSYPWPNAANVKYPLLTTAALQFSSRAYPALVPGPNLVRGRVIGFDEDGSKTERAIRIGKHMSYQLMEQMENWEEDMDKLSIIIPIVGCAFKKTYYSNIKKQNISELVLAQDLVVDYYAKSLEDATRVTHRLSLTARDIKERQLNGIYSDVDLSPPTGSTEDTSASDLINGTAEPDNDESTPYSILEQHRYLDLDDDGYAEPYIVVIEEESSKVLRIVARFDPQGIEVVNDQVVYIEPVQYFTKFPFIPNPDGGFYDVGFGSLLGPVNATIDSAINQLLDAGTLSNMPSGFLGRGIRLKGGNYRFSPGEWKFVNTTGDDLKKGIVPLPVNAPSTVVFQLLGLMISAGERLSSTMDSMVGENPGQNQKATTTMAVLEQGMKVFSGIYKRLYRSLKKELKKLYRLNAMYLPLEEYFMILDPDQETAAMIGRGEYEIGTADVVPSADPNVATEQQRLAKAAGLMEMLQLGTVNPVEVTKRILEAQEQPGIEQLMQMPPPQPSMEEVQFQDESKRAWAELELQAAKIEADILVAKATAILNVAKAEQAEEGSQLEIYKLQLAAMQSEEEAIQARLSGAMESKEGKKEDDKE